MKLDIRDGVIVNRPRNKAERRLLNQAVYAELVKPQREAEVAERHKARAEKDAARAALVARAGAGVFKMRIAGATWAQCTDALIGSGLSPEALGHEVWKPSVASRLCNLYIQSQSGTAT